MRSTPSNPRARGASGTHSHKQNQKKNRRIAIIVACSLVVALLITVVAVTIANWDEYRQLARDRDVVAECNGYEIPYEELRFVTMLYKSELEVTYGEGIWDDPATAEAHRAELEALVEKNLIQNYIVLAACDELGIQTESKTIDNYVDEQIDALKDECGSRADFRAFLEENYMSERFLRFSLGINYLQSSIHYTLRDNDLYTYRIEDNSAEFKDYVESSGQYVRILHVYIENGEGEDPAENLARATTISRELQAITDPDERRDRMSDYIGSKDNDDFSTVTGDGYYFTHGEMDELYEQAAFALEIGEVSDPVVCSGGNFILLRLEPDRAYIDDNVTTLLNNYHAVALNDYIESFRSACTITFTEEGQAIDLVAME